MVLSVIILALVIWKPLNKSITTYTGICILSLGITIITALSFKELVETPSDMIEYRKNFMIDKKADSLGTFVLQTMMSTCVINSMMEGFEQLLFMKSRIKNKQNFSLVLFGSIGALIVVIFGVSILLNISSGNVEAKDSYLNMFLHPLTSNKTASWKFMVTLGSILIPGSICVHTLTNFTNQLETLKRITSIATESHFEENTPNAQIVMTVLLETFCPLLLVAFSIVSVYLS